jgi:hypothetical protein
LDPSTCQNLECIAKFLGQYQNVITPVFTAIAGFLGGWILHITAINKERRYTHFDDLKENVISPILYNLTIKPYAFPSIEEAEKQAILYTLPSRSILQLTPIEKEQQGREFDPVLLRDFLDNHYTQILTIWNSFYVYNNEVLKKDSNAEELITKKKLEDLLTRDDYNKVSDPSRSHKLDKDGFKSQLKNLIITAESGCSKIEEDPSQPGRILFNTKIIYMMNENDDKNKILAYLRTLCCSITLDDTIIKELRGSEGYNIMLQNRNETLREFITKINTIHHQTRLKIVRKRSGIIKCQFIK